MVICKLFICVANPAVANLIKRGGIDFLVQIKLSSNQTAGGDVIPLNRVGDDFAVLEISLFFDFFCTPTHTHISTHVYLLVVKHYIWSPDMIRWDV